MDRRRSSGGNRKSDLDGNTSASPGFGGHPVTGRPGRCDPGSIFLRKGTFPSGREPGKMPQRAYLNFMWRASCRMVSRCSQFSLLDAQGHMGRQRQETPYQGSD